MSEGAQRPSRMVRKGGFEPPRSCERQPLKLVRLPVPPLPRLGVLTTGHWRPGRVSHPNRGARTPQPADYFFGASAGALGCGAGVVAGAAGVEAGADAGAVCAAGVFTPLTTDAGPFCHITASAIDPIMNMIAAAVVARVNTVAPEIGRAHV